MITESVREYHTLEHRHYRMHYAAQGDRRNPLLLLVHPAMSDHSSFEEALRGFAHQYRVVAPDLPGHGQTTTTGQPASMADASELLTALIAAQGQHSADLLGVSLGALVVQDCAVRFPEQVKTLTVVGGYPIFQTNPAVQRAQALEIVKLLPLVLFSMERLRRSVARSVVITPAAQTLFYTSSQHLTRRSFQAMSGTGSLMRPAAGQHRQPVLIVVGDHERAIVRSEATRWQQRQPGSSLAVITNAGHCANMDQPTQFQQVVSGWLETKLMVS